MSGPGVPTCLVLLAALSSAAVVIDGAAKGDIVKAVAKAVHKVSVPTTKTPAVSRNKDSAPQESKKVGSQSPSKRHIRKFDFDAEFASYLGLASQADTARYLAGEQDSSFRAPTAFQESPDGNVYPALRLIPGSTPASFAYFTQIYPDEHSDGDIRIEHFSPVIHPLSSEREKSRYRQQETDEEDPEPYDRSKSNYYPNEVPLYAPPTSRSYFGRYSNKQKYSESSEVDDQPKPNKLQSSKQPYRQPTGFDDESTPDYKMGYRHVGMYHKFHEEDLYPKKTSSEWIPLKQSSKKRKQNQEDPRDTNDHDPDAYHDAHVSSEDFHVRSEHDDEVTRIKTNIENDPPYSTNNFDLADKKGPSIGKLKTKGTTHRGVDDYGKGYSPTAEAESPFQPPQRTRKHKRRRKKKKKKKHHRHHHHRRPGYRSSGVESTPFTNPGKNLDYKAPNFEFQNPVNSYVSPPYTPPETHHKSKLKSEPFKNQAEEPYKPPSEPFRVSGPENDLPLSAEADKDVSFDDGPETAEEPADIDYGPVKLDDLDEDYHIISEAGPREHAEHTKDFDKRLPHPDEKVYGSFETFDSQLDSASSKKFEPFVQYPFDEQRKKLASVVEELIESGKSR